MDADNDGNYEYVDSCNTSTPPSYTYNSAGTYTAVLKVSDGKYEDKEFLTIKVEQVNSPWPITQTYYKINITNPNTYSLTDYQVKIALTKAVNGDQVFDFYDDFNNGNVKNWEIKTTLPSQSFSISGGYMILNGPSSGGKAVKIRTVDKTLSGEKIYEGKVYYQSGWYDFRYTITTTSAT